MIRRALQRIVVSVLTIALSSACGGNSARTSPDDAPIVPTGPNTLTLAEQRSGWTLLFDGRTLTGWHSYQKALGMTPGWDVQNGAIARVGEGGDLVSDLQFDTFELSLEWRISPGGNSGVLYWGNEGTAHIYENAPEMQVLDNIAHPDGKSPLTAAGSLFALYPAPVDLVKPVGEWNEARIVSKGSKVQHWLNGVKVVEVDFDSREMKAKIAASKFKEWESFGKARRGHLALQDHESAVWFRNIKIRETVR